MAKRLVYAEDVKEQIDEWLEVVGTAYVGKGLSYYGELLGCIEDASTVEKWIPCSERLPECDYGYESTEGVLFQLKSGSIEVGFYGTGGIQRDKYFRVYRDGGEGFDVRDVVAWMPLPEPYKGY